MGATTRSFWESGIDHELDFWQRYLASGGMDMPDDFRWRFDPNSPLQPHIADMVPLDIPVSDLAILDCAAGPATTRGRTHIDLPLSEGPKHHNSVSSQSSADLWHDTGGCHTPVCAATPHVKSEHSSNLFHLANAICPAAPMEHLIHYIPLRVYEVNDELGVPAVAWDAVCQAPRLLDSGVEPQ